MVTAHRHPAPAARGRLEELPQPTQKARRTRAFCVGWGSWIRTSENARVKVWCLTAWLYPNIFMRPLLYHKLARMSRTFFAIFDDEREFTGLSSFCYEKIMIIHPKGVVKAEKMC